MTIYKSIAYFLVFALLTSSAAEAKAPQKSWFAGTAIGDFIYNYTRENLYEFDAAPPRNADIEIVKTRIEKLGLKAQELELLTQDNLKLKALLIRQPQQRKTKIFFHGNTGGLGSFMAHVKLNYQKGFNVVLFSYRNYSHNPGKASEAGIMYDADALLAKLKSKIPGLKSKDIYFHAHSLGSAVALKTATRMAQQAEAPQEILLHAPFSSIHDMAVIHFANLIPKFFIERIIPNIWNSIENLELMTQELKAKGLALPRLKIYHGTEDKIVPIKQSMDLYKRALELGFEAEYHQIKGFNHNHSIVKLMN